MFHSPGKRFRDYLCRLHRVLAVCCGAAVLFTTGLHAQTPSAPIAPSAAYNREESKVAQFTLQDPLRSDDGMEITSVAGWRARREEILQTLRRDMFGFSPKATLTFKPSDLMKSTGVLGGLAVRRQVTLRPVGHAVGPAIHLLLYLPISAKKPVPVFLGLNYAGNVSVSHDPGILLGTVWSPDPANRLVLHPERATEAMRGSAASQWPIEEMLRRGYGFATVYDGDLEPDFAGGRPFGFRALPELAEPLVPEDERWGAIGVWAWGLSRALDYLQTLPGVDAQQVVVVGHSRLGKAAIWAGAQDERFAMVISNESGKGGAALMKRNFGETVEHLNIRFPYWFDGQFRSYSDATDKMPFDSHLLLALIAPRPLYVASAAGDYTLDARGEYLAVLAASPVYRLYGYEGIRSADMPPLNEPTGERLRYHIRPGKHDMNEFDWSAYLMFADGQLKREPAR